MRRVGADAMNDRLAIVVPVRSLAGGKTRLSPDVSPKLRGALTGLMLSRVLGRACASGVAECVLLVSPDERALALAADAGCAVEPVFQPTERAGLNSAIDLGREWATTAGATAMLVLFADLPLLTAEDVRAMAEAGADLVVGTDGTGAGTNALRLRLGDDTAGFRFRFGEGSAAAHRAEARAQGLTGTVRHAPGIAFDLDTPDDWRRFLDSDVAREWGLSGAPLGAAR
jgi:2-phospho-L-lactate/phosphoenolpyruvate guanylyltransferase